LFTFRNFLLSEDSLGLPLHIPYSYYNKWEWKKINKSVTKIKSIMRPFASSSPSQILVVTSSFNSCSIFFMKAHANVINLMGLIKYSLKTYLLTYVCFSTYLWWVSLFSSISTILNLVGASSSMSGMIFIPKYLRRSSKELHNLLYAFVTILWMFQTSSSRGF